MCSSVVRTVEDIHHVTLIKDLQVFIRCIRTSNYDKKELETGALGLLPFLIILIFIFRKMGWFVLEKIYVNMRLEPATLGTVRDSSNH